MKKKAFTLIELLVVATIVVILTVIVVVNLEKAQAKSRDTQRKADLSKIAAALEMYKAEKKFYIASCGAGSTCDNSSGATYPCQACPVSGGGRSIVTLSIDPTNTTTGVLRGLVGGGFIQSLPKDPSRTGTNEFYNYIAANDGGTYGFKVTAQSETISIPSGSSCTSSSTIADAKNKAGDFYDPSSGACTRLQVSSTPSALNSW